MEQGRNFAAVVYNTFQTLSGEKGRRLVDAVGLVKRLWPRARPLAAAVSEALAIHLAEVWQEAELDTTGDWVS